MTAAIKVSAILLAGGKGTRMNSAVPKQFLPLRDKAICQYSFDLLSASSLIDEVVVVAETPFHSFFKGHARFAKPGLRRQDSVANGLEQCQAASELILIHDAARPLLTAAHIEQAIDAAKEMGAAALAVPLKFTVKQADEAQMVQKTPDRRYLFEVQTPQVIRRKWLTQGLKLAADRQLDVVDDVSFAELLGQPVKLIASSYQNIKVTTMEDLLIAQIFLTQRELT